MKVIHPLLTATFEANFVALIDQMQFLLFYELKVCLGKYSSFADGFFIRQPMAKTEREAPLYKPLVLNSLNGNIHTKVQSS